MRAKFVLTMVLFTIAARCVAQTGIDAYGNPNPNRSAGTAASDDFALLNQINKASIVMLRETMIVPAPVAGRIAQAIATVDANNAQPGA